MSTTGPEVLFSTAPFYRSPLREAFRHVREAGYEAVEVMVTADPATQDAHTLRELGAEFGLRIGALHAPFLLLTRRVWGSDPVGKIYRAAQVAEQAEIPLVVVHPPYRWQVRYRRWAEESLPDYSARAGIRVAVENMFPVKLRGDRGLRFHSSQDFEDLDRFGHLVLDTSHLGVSRFDVLEAYRRYRDKVVHIHLSDNAGKGWDSHLPLGDERGTLPLEELLREIAGDSFDGTIALELDLRPYIGDDDAVKRILVDNRVRCEELLAVRT
jgi:sugar phosphate isomerase/epimerase